MRVHFIEDNNIKAMFFPDTMKFYEINDSTRTLVELLINEEDLEVISKKTSASIETIQSVKKILDENQGRVKEFNSFNDNMLGKLVLNITNKCNLGCKYCYASGGNYCSEESIMKEDFAIEILEKFYKRYEVIKTIQLFGGEPTLNLKTVKRVCEFIDQRYRSGVLKEKPIIGIVTNGTIVNDEFINIINSYDVKVTVSLDGPPVVNDKMRIYKNGVATSNTVISNIKFLKSKTNQPSNIEATYNIHHVNENVKVIDVAEFIKNDLKIENSHIVPASGSDESDFILRDRNPFVSSVEDVFEGLKEGNNVSYSLVNRVIGALRKKVTSCYLCEAGISMYSVSTKGDVYSCFMFTDNEEQRFGNIKDENFFESERFKKKKEALKSFNKFKEGKCKDCFNNTICKGCIGINNIETGDVHKPSDINCDMNRAITEKVIIGIIRDRNRSQSVSVR